MATDPPPPAVIDLAGFTQSELLSLSRCSSSHSVLDQRDVLIPEIDRSIFNESDATLRQTNSEVQLCANRRKRRSESGDSDVDENRLIVGLLKDLIKTSTLHDPAEEERLKGYDEIMVDCEVGGGGNLKTRRRGRKVESSVFDEEIVNRNGVVVDLVALENALDPYGEELKRRTAGLVSEEDCLGFLGGLNGVWGSTRKKRRIIDACEFGDHLPVRWKLLLALRRREGRIWLYCRRYISPRGQEFVSCKDVALYLQSLFGSSNDQLVDVNMDIIQKSAGTLFKEDNLENGNFPVAALHKSSVYEQGRGMALEGIEQLVDVQVSSVYECHQCKLLFHEKKLYLQHVLSCHEKTTKRYRLGSRDRNGVILDNGQYECQFCYKIFQEKDSYGGHVEVHLIGRKSEAGNDAELVTLSDRSLQPFFGKVDSSIKKLPIHCLDNSTSVDQNEFCSGLTPFKPNVPASKDGILNHVPGNQDTEKDHENQLKFEVNSNLVPDIYPENSKFAGLTGNAISLSVDLTRLDDQHSKVLESQIQVPSDDYEKCNFENISPACVADSDHSIKSSGDFCELKSLVQPSDHLTESSFTQCEGEGFSSSCQKLETAGEFELEYNVQTIHKFETNTDTLTKQNLERSVMTSSELVLPGDIGKSRLKGQPSDQFIEYVSTPHEGSESRSFRQMPESSAEFEELKQNDIETPKISFPSRKKLLPLSVVPTRSEKDAEVNEFDDNRIAAGGNLCSMECRLQVTAVCVWCNSEFIYEVVDAELLADSVGYMCTACREKISAQFTTSTLVYP